MELDLLAGPRQIRLHQRVVQQSGQALQDEREILGEKVANGEIS